MTRISFLIQMQLSQKQNTTFQSVSAFLKSILTFVHFQTKDQCHSWCFSEITGSENRAKNKPLKSPLSEEPLLTNILKVTKHCWNLNGTTFTIFIDHCEGNWLRKKALLVIWKFLQLFLNTLTADAKYSLLNRDNLREPIQMQLSQKQERISERVSAFLKARLNFENFQ